MFLSENKSCVAVKWELRKMGNMVPQYTGCVFCFISISYFFLNKYAVILLDTKNKVGNTSCYLNDKDVLG